MRWQLQSAEFLHIARPMRNDEAIIVRTIVNRSIKNRTPQYSVRQEPDDCDKSI